MRGRSLAAGLIAGLLLTVTAAVLAGKYDSSGREIVVLGTTAACERNSQSPNNGYCITFPDWNLDAYTLAGADIAVSPVPTRAGTVHINTALSAHTISIKDGTTVKCVIPASAAAGSEFDGCAGRYDTSLVVSPNAAGTGGISIQWRPQ